MAMIDPLNTLWFALMTLVVVRRWSKLLVASLVGAGLMLILLLDRCGYRRSKRPCGHTTRTWRSSLRTMETVRMEYILYCECFNTFLKGNACSVGNN